MKLSMLLAIGLTLVAPPVFAQHHLVHSGSISVPVSVKSLGAIEHAQLSAELKIERANISTEVKAERTSITSLGALAKSSAFSNKAFKANVTLQVRGEKAALTSEAKVLRSELTTLSNNARQQIAFGTLNGSLPAGVLSSLEGISVVRQSDGSILMTNR